MTAPHSQGNHVARLFQSLRLPRGLKPGQLAARLDAANSSKVGSLIRCFELGESIPDHRLQKLLAERQPYPAELRRCVELDRAEDDQRLVKERLQWGKLADEPIDPSLSVGAMPGFGVTIPAPINHLSS